MSPEAQQALRTIYERAHTDGSANGNQSSPTKDGKEHHVVMAMRASTRFPEIFKFTMMNIATRIVLKMAQQSSNIALAQQKQEMLDDFHVALNVFCSDHLFTMDSLESQVNSLLPSHHLWLISDSGRGDDIVAFKSRSTPAVAKVRQLHAKRS